VKLRVAADDLRAFASRGEALVGKRQWNQMAGAAGGPLILCAHW
jgi:hypothetical protein